MYNLYILKIVLSDKEKERLFSKISVDPKTQCWNWIGAKTRGYGAIRLRGKTYRAHRVFYELLVEPLPEYAGVNVLDHVVCNNPSCCNPKHVKLVKQSYNILRANSISAINKKKTHCIRGHLLPKPNEPYGNNGKFMRRCVICRRANRMKRYYANKSK